MNQPVYPQSKDSGVAWPGALPEGRRCEFSPGQYVFKKVSAPDIETR